MKELITKMNDIETRLRDGYNMLYEDGEIEPMSLDAYYYDAEVGEEKLSSPLINNTGFPIRTIEERSSCNHTRCGYLRGNNE